MYALLIYNMKFPQISGIFLLNLRCFGPLLGKFKCQLWPHSYLNYIDRTESMQKYFFFFPQTGEKDMTKPNQCPKCVRKFELEDDLWQVREP